MTYAKSIFKKAYGAARAKRNAIWVKSGLAPVCRLYGAQDGFYRYQLVGAALVGMEASGLPTGRQYKIAESAVDVSFSQSFIVRKNTLLDRLQSFKDEKEGVYISDFDFQGDQYICVLPSRKNAEINLRDAK